MHLHVINVVVLMKFLLNETDHYHIWIPSHSNYLLDMINDILNVLALHV
jgi:hypothetical protein